MSFLSHPSQMQPSTNAGLPRPSLLERMLDALSNDRQDNAERVWVDMLERNGGRLTDELERRISLHA